jgi:hypothetical protein
MALLAPLAGRSPCAQPGSRSSWTARARIAHNPRFVITFPVPLSSHWLYLIAGWRL